MQRYFIKEDYRSTLERYEEVFYSLESDWLVLDLVSIVLQLKAAVCVMILLCNLSSSKT